MSSSNAPIKPAYLTSGTISYQHTPVKPAQSTPGLHNNPGGTNSYQSGVLNLNPEGINLNLEGINSNLGGIIQAQREIVGGQKVKQTPTLPQESSYSQASYPI